MLVNRQAKILLLICWLIGGVCSCAASSSTVAADAQAVGDAALTKARANIEKFRKGAAQIKIVDERGKPVSSVNLKIRQVAHDFKFGCYVQLYQLPPQYLALYEQRFTRLFNFAIVGTYWGLTESERGKENWQVFEQELAFAKKNNLRVQAAPILWGTNEAGTPKWLPREHDELNRILDNRLRIAMQKKGVDEWEVVNEPLAPTPDFFAANAGADYVEKAFRNARQIQPQAKLMINEFGVFGAVSKNNRNRDRYFEFVKKMIEKNVPFDIIGIQAHANGEWFSPAAVAADLERYATLGKPLQISEFSAQTLNFNDRKTPIYAAGNYQNGVWNADKQARFYREFYTVAFGNESVEAITTWGLDDARAWLPGIGLLDERGEPKAAYSELDKLINNEWKTDLSAATNATGNYDFRGFYGTYEIEVSAPNRKTKTAKFDLRKDAANKWTITLEK